MKRLDLQQPGETPHFIGSWQMEPSSICDDLVRYFDSRQSLQRRGMTGKGLDVASKDTVDLTILPKEVQQPENEVLRRYFEALDTCYKDYLRQWPFFSKMITDLEIGAFNIQRYLTGQHYKKVHTERSGLSSLHRVLAWMTYLDDVEVDAGGSTYFSHYDLAVQPAKGLTLIWPAEWTHAHRGNVIKSGTKHIITGWLHFSQ